MYDPSPCGDYFVHWLFHSQTSFITTMCVHINRGRSPTSLSSVKQLWVILLSSGQLWFRLVGRCLAFSRGACKGVWLRPASNWFLMQVFTLPGVQQCVCCLRPHGGDLGPCWDIHKRLIESLILYLLYMLSYLIWTSCQWHGHITKATVYPSNMVVWSVLFYKLVSAATVARIQL